MIPDIDIWRCANELIKQYGDLADIEAATRADQYEAKGERDGQRVWMPDGALRAFQPLSTVADPNKAATWLYCKDEQGCGHRVQLDLQAAIDRWGDYAGRCIP